MVETPNDDGPAPVGFFEALLKEGMKVGISHPDLKFEYWGVVESIGTMAERKDVHIKLSNGKGMVLMVRKENR